MSARSMELGFVAKLMANSRSRIAHWQCTKTQRVRDGRPLLGTRRTERRLLRRLGHGLPPTILDECGRMRLLVFNGDFAGVYNKPASRRQINISLEARPFCRGYPPRLGSGAGPQRSPREEL